MSWKDAAAAAQIGGAIVGGLLGIGSQAVTPNVEGMQAYNNIAELDSGSKDSDTPDLDSTSTSASSDDDDE
jgi:hypothetical protein